MNNKVFIKTDKFITDYSVIARVIPFAFYRDNVALINIYNAILLKSLHSVKGEREIHDFLHENYGAKTYCYCSLMDNTAYLSFRFECLCKEYLPNNEDVFKNILELSKEIFFETPDFNEELIEKNKKELISYIKKQAKTPSLICYKKSLMQVDPNHQLCFDILGDIKDVKKINKKALIKFNEELRKFPISFIYEGNNHGNEFELLKEIYTDDFNFPLYQDNRLKECEYIYNEEYFQTSNTNITMIYSFKMDYSIRNAYKLRLFNYILGGNSSILFNEIREKNGLCYSVSSLGYVSENIVEISSKISKENVDSFIENVKNIISNFSSFCNEDYFYKAKMDIVSELIDLEDDPASLFNNNVTLIYKRNRTNSYDKVMKELETITYDEIVEFSKELSLISTYVVKGDN